MNLKFAVKQLFRRFGIEVSQTSPDASLGLFVTTLIAHLGINCVLDVGAHFGEFAMTLRNHGYHGEIVSFEPIPEHVVRLERLAAHDRHWTVVPYALGSTDTEMPINVAQSGDLTSFRTPRTDTVDRFTEIIRTQRTETVPVMRLDTVVGEVTQGLARPRIFLKLDTQGWDLEVIKGAEHSLGQVLAIQSEMAVQPLYEKMPLYRDSIDALKAHGFELSAMYPINRDQDGALIEFDGILVRPHSA
jgi:FkbM family methyltransferase